MSGPLAGVRVLDLSRLLPLSYATQLLVDAGAEVIKVEAPGGEYGRGMDAAFQLSNRGKRSVTLDLRAPQARGILLELVATYDVLVESFRPGYMAGLGLGYEHLSVANLALVYCSATGYGQSGPYANRAGHDLNYAALGGLLTAPGVPTAVPLTPFIDMSSGWAVAFAIAAAVVGSRGAGRGRHVDISMADVALSLNTLGVAETVATSGAGGSQGSSSVGGPLDGYPWPDLMAQRCPCYGVFTTGDGREVALANVEPKFWRAFVAAIDCPELEDQRFATGEAGRRGRDRVQAAIGARSFAEWDAAFATTDVCYAPVNTPAQALANEHYRSRGSVLQAPDGSWQLRAARFGDDGADSRGVPAAGEANREVYGSHGHSEDEVRAWHAAGVV